MDFERLTQLQKSQELARCCENGKPLFLVLFDGKPEPNYSQKVCKTCLKNGLYSKFVISVVSLEVITKLHSNQ